MDNGKAALGGFLLGLYVMGIVILLWGLVPTFSHDVGWEHQVCVTTTDRDIETVKTTTNHCITGEELATWAKEKGR